jgi:hypothetical protein
MAKTMTYVDVINQVLAGEALTDEMTEKLEALKVSLMKRNSAKSGGETKEQRERKALAETVYEAMEPDVVYSTSDIAALAPELAGATPQKITPLMRLLGDKVTVTKVKGKNCYSLNPNFEGDAE